MLTVDDIEQRAEVPKKKEKQRFGTLFKINPYERLEKKEALKNLGRNSKCVCGSGKKFKKCCISKMKFENTYELEDNHREQSKAEIKTEMTEVFGTTTGGFTGIAGTSEHPSKGNTSKNKSKQNRKGQKRRHKTIGS